jgi:LPS-assembly lipoprotein
VPYDDQFLRDKSEEFQLIYDDLEQSLVPRVLRRLTAPDVREAAHKITAQSAATDESPLVAPDLAPLPADQPDAWQRDPPQPNSMFDR